VKEEENQTGGGGGKEIDQGPFTDAVTVLQGRRIGSKTSAKNIFISWWSPDMGAPLESTRKKGLADGCIFPWVNTPA